MRFIESAARRGKISDLIMSVPILLPALLPTSFPRVATRRLALSAIDRHVRPDGRWNAATPKFGLITEKTNNFMMRPRLPIKGAAHNMDDKSILNGLSIRFHFTAELADVFSQRGKTCGVAPFRKLVKNQTRIVDVNEGMSAVVDPGRGRGIQQICSLTSGLARSTGSKEGEENLDDTTEQKNLSATCTLAVFAE
ncbi:hypothetical protein DBV15_10581 [Temnothorax longispinosus]|uniref:Uncharacterized protein n=1 Tax=Temnothorax longispinosus TaxID=300112 RepID=A0A4S2JMR0_9HYME|nr:hypothetical protein DBV15_10581 [Temnothorax longispinosus]